MYTVILTVILYSEQLRYLTADNKPENSALIWCGQVHDSSVFHIRGATLSLGCSGTISVTLKFNIDLWILYFLLQQCRQCQSRSRDWLLYNFIVVEISCCFSIRNNHFLPVKFWQLFLPVKSWQPRSCNFLVSWHCCEHQNKILYWKIKLSFMYMFL